MIDPDALPLPAPLEYAVPAGACDAHTHVFAAPEDFAPVQPAAYPLPVAPISRHRQVAQQLGIDRAVLVQPAAYGANHSVMLQALHAYPATLRGVALCDRDATDGALDHLHDAGIRALRFVEMRVPGSSQRYPGSIDVAALEHLAPRMAQRGWHAEIWADVSTNAAIVRRFSRCGVPLVLDHLAGATIAEDPDSEDFRTILDALETGVAWAKLSICRVGHRRTEYPLARPFHDALVAANPDRVVWGSDFPFLRKGEEAPDCGWLLNTFRDWVGDDARVRRILVDNSATLYSF